MIALDVMGGDYAPGAILEGSLRAAKKSIPVMLFGPATLVRAELDKLDPAWESYCLSVSDAPDIVAMDDEPVLAVRKKPDSSLVKAVASVKAGQCVTVVSAGNSGALMAAATFLLGRQEGIERPAIAGLMPSLNGNILMLDLGANTDCRPQYLLQFARLGTEYARNTLNINNPRVGLLSNGHEAGKGSQLVKDAFELLTQDKSINFIGNVEPYDLLENRSDIIISDGFAGNVFLKTVETTFELCMKLLKQDIGEQQDNPAIQIWAKNFFTKISAKLHHKRFGGAFLLGVKGNVIVCHGSSDAKTIEHALVFAWESARNQQK